MSGLKLKKEKTRKRIIESAALVFAEKGYAGTTISDVAGRAGIGKGTVYGYFRGKEDLFFSVFEWFMEEIGSFASVGISVLGRPVAERLSALSGSVMASCIRMKDMYSLVIEFWAAATVARDQNRFKDLFRQGYADYRKLVSALIQDGISRGEFREDIDPEPIAATLVGTWDALGLQAWFDEDFDPEKASDEFMKVFISGLTRQG
jgi:AcrR family transcriptional regulator